MPFDPLSSCSLDVQSCRFSPSITPMSTISSQETWSEREGEGIEDDNDQIRRKIEEEMYKQLCGLYDIIKMESVLEQYVLRELRHLQEYLCHKYPPIMAYLRVPFDEIIECARGKTKGLNITCPDSKNRPVSVQRLSAPSPMKIASPSGSVTVKGARGFVLKLKYRPEIDSLRAISVLGVIIYHSKIYFFGELYATLSSYNRFHRRFV